MLIRKKLASVNYLFIFKCVYYSVQLSNRQNILTTILKVIFLKQFFFAKMYLFIFIPLKKVKSKPLINIYLHTLPTYLYF